MQSVAKMNSRKSVLPIGEETIRFIWRKISSLMPDYVIAWFIAFFLREITAKSTLKSVVSAFLTKWWELFFVKMTGLNGGGINGVTWYVSAMLLTMFILYPMLRKFPDVTIHIVIPLSSMFVLGWLFRNGNLRGPTLWLGFAYKGFLRGFAEIGLGVLCYVIVQKIKNAPMTRFAKVFITLVKWSGYLSIILYMWKIESSMMDYAFLLILCISIGLTFSEQGIGSNLYQGKLIAFWGKLSVPLYLSHTGFYTTMKKFFPQIASNRRLLMLYLLLSFGTSLFVMALSTHLKNKSRKIFDCLGRLFIEESAAKIDI